MRKVVFLAGLFALAACAYPASSPNDAAVSRRLDQARAEITPPLGATTYTLDRQRLLDQPGGENNSIAAALTQLPGVTAGPDGAIHVRGQ